MFEKLLKQWANEQGFDGWSQDHAAVLRNLSKWLNTHAVEQPLALDADWSCKNCGFENHGSWSECGECQTPRK